MAGARGAQRVWKSAVELEGHLAQHGLNPALYGVGGAKSVEQLREEIAKGESLLRTEGGRLERVVEVLSVMVRGRGGTFLLEDRQVLPTGESRSRRGVFLSEKLVPGEDWRAAVPRAVTEELGSLRAADSDEFEIRVDEATYRKTVAEKVSNSYPGLLSKYHMHTVQAEVTLASAPLPAEYFDTWEPRPGGRLRTFWRWGPADSADGEGENLWS